MKSNYDDTLRFIKEFISENGIPPSRREIAEGAGFKSISTVAHALDRLVELERIRIIPNVARGIVVLKEK